ncbi:Chromo (CHRromatin Organization MOdifier) domain [Carpediemonas membranifera]|uniref:Chromo (CHRromatin Organization MOdifier) domain n=1 Tax=Carpediemonas membranifera TaxID=201153 RepID=A0A8J6DYW3_9EUKA|nr:Chromo (CHRromatin Organization MOdifier) domain [Carpediemonas membranifera]|eukprot:KAG9389888.1 Chromo (CHRromatin Organization MOdifier) domain [Carpediemonas membranifera]
MARWSELYASCCWRRKTTSGSTGSPVAQLVINSAPHSTLGGMSPLQCLFGISPAVLKSAEQLAPMAEAVGAPADLAEWARARQGFRAAAEQAVGEYERRQAAKQPAESQSKVRTGDLYFVRWATRQTKLTAKARGPMQAVGQGESPNTWRMKDLISHKVVLIHEERISVAKVSMEQAVRLAARDHQEFVVERIVGHKLGSRKNRSAILIEWAGFEPDEATWEPLNAANAQLRALDDYLDTLTSVSRKRLEGTIPKRH